MHTHTQSHKQANTEHTITTEILDIIYHPVFYLKHNVSETRFRLLQVVPLDYLCQLDPTEYISPEDRDRIQSLKCCDLNKRKNNGECLKF
jgi:hypothetical protein